MFTFPKVMNFINNLIEVEMKEKVKEVIQARANYFESIGQHNYEGCQLLDVLAVIEDLIPPENFDVLNSQPEKQAMPEVTGEELKSCPFCGGKATKSTRKDKSLWNHSIVDWYSVGCDNCGIKLSQCEDDDKIIEKWNARISH